MIEIDIKNRFSGEVQFTAKIDCKNDAPESLKLRLAVLWAIENKASLSGADLSGANLSGANLSEADLSEADLSGAYLSRADLSRAYLSRADLSGAYLSWADLSRANLSGADLSGADLSWADLSGADLSWADLSRADLSGADLSRADLSRANGLKTKPPQTVITPGGELHVYKKLLEGVAKLVIPAEAKRSNATGRKCRAEFAIVKELPEGCVEGTSKHDCSFKYRVGEIVRPHEWCDDWKQECAGGIHFFLTREEAEEY